MSLTRFKKYAGKYCNCEISHFSFSLVGKKISHKGYEFWKLEGSEEAELAAMPQAERAEVLSGMWGYYMLMQD